MSFTSRITNYIITYSWAGTEFLPDLLSASIRYFAEILVLIFLYRQRKWAYWLCLVGAGISSPVLVYGWYTINMMNLLEGYPYALLTNILTGIQGVSLLTAFMIMLYMFIQNRKNHPEKCAN